MSAVAEYAGYLAAHHLERIAQGQSVIPMLCYEAVDGSREVLRLPEPAAEGLAQASAWLKDNPESANLAVVTFEGSVVLDYQDTTALICKAVQYQPEEVSFKIAVPYERDADNNTFKIFRVKILEYEGPDPNYETLVASIFEGVEQNESAADLWFEHLDQSK